MAQATEQAFLVVQQMLSASGKGDVMARSDEYANTPHAAKLFSK